jgi:hypothetical protein
LGVDGLLGGAVGDELVELDGCELGELDGDLVGCFDELGETDGLPFGPPGDPGWPEDAEGDGEPDGTGPDPVRGSPGWPAEPWPPEPWPPCGLLLRLTP